MAASRKGDAPPLLAPGAHCVSLAELKALTVGRFEPPHRDYRERLFLQLEEFVQRLLIAKIPGELSVDGSFLTEKPRPGDVDVVFVIDHDVSEALSADQDALIFEINSTVFVNSVDSLAIVRYPRGHQYFGTVLDGANMNSHYGIENSEEWTKGYAILRLGETDVGRRIRR